MQVNVFESPYNGLIDLDGFSYTDAYYTDGKVVTDEFTIDSRPWMSPSINLSSKEGFANLIPGYSDIHTTATVGLSIRFISNEVVHPVSAEYVNVHIDLYPSMYEPTSINVDGDSTVFYYEFNVAINGRNLDLKFPNVQLALPPKYAGNKFVAEMEMYILDLWSDTRNRNSWCVCYDVAVHKNGACARPFIMECTPVSSTVYTYKFIDSFRYAKEGKCVDFLKLEIDGGPIIRTQNADVEIDRVGESIEYTLNFDIPNGQYRHLAKTKFNLTMSDGTVGSATHEYIIYTNEWFYE